MKLMKLGLEIARQEADSSLLSNWDKVSALTLVSAASSNGLGTSTPCSIRCCLLPVLHCNPVPLINWWFWKVQFSLV